MIGTRLEKWKDSRRAPAFIVTPDDSLEHCFAQIVSKVSPPRTVPFVRLFHAKEGYQKTGLR
jgi:hypothetical protein